MGLVKHRLLRQLLLCVVRNALLWHSWMLLDSDGSLEVGMVLHAWMDGTMLSDFLHGHVIDELAGEG
jgi:hypothetical protein